MLSIALDEEGNKIRLICISGLAHQNVISALRSARFDFDDLGTFLEIKNDTDWKGMLTALGFDAKKARRKRGQSHVMVVKF